MNACDYGTIEFGRRKESSGPISNSLLAVSAPSGCQNGQNRMAEGRGPTTEGWLFKKSPAFHHNWQKRWFQLHPSEFRMTYRKDEVRLTLVHRRALWKSQANLILRAALS